MKKDTLGNELVVGELFDLSLYRMLRKRARGDMAILLDELIGVEEQHLRFWQDFFEVSHPRLGIFLKIRLAAFGLAARLFGEAGVSLMLEAIEINGIRKYLAVWERYKNEPLGAVVRRILDDEFRHEDAIVSDKINRQIRPERIRNIFLGLNDGLVEILGAVSGFFIAFETIAAVLSASFTVAIAGAFSMAAGAFVAVGAEREAEAVEKSKQYYLEGKKDAAESAKSPFGAALLIGASYLVGAAIPILPVFFGAENVLLSFGVSLVVVTFVSAFLAFLSGMDVKRRIGINVFIVALSVLVTALIGSVARRYFGIEV